MSFWDELRRRNVFKVGVAYLVVAWLLAQVIDVVLPTFNAPAWVGQTLIFVLVLGVPIVLIVAWAFEITPEGIKKTSSVPTGESITQATGQKLNYIVTGLLALALGFVIVDQYVLTDASSEVVARPASPLDGAAEPVGSSAVAARRSVLPNSVAVLPFQNFSPDEQDAYFAAGIHEEILNYLAKLKALNVIARTSMVQYTNTDKTIPQIAEELNVGTVMEGSVRYAGNRVRVTTQLIDAETGAHLWSEAYEREFEDIFAIQADIAMNVANALNAEFSLEEQRAIEQPRTSSPEAYALYLQFINLVGTGNQGPQALAFADRIIARDPAFADAYGAKAWLYSNMLINTTVGAAGDAEELEALTRENAARALELDPAQGDAHSALAILDLFSWRWPEARAAYERYTNETGRTGSYQNWFDAWSGRIEQALEGADRAVALDPRVWSAHWSQGIVLTYAGRYDDAVEAFRRGVALSPALSLEHSWLAIAELSRGSNAGALEALQFAEQLLGTNRVLISLVDLIYGYGRIGRDEDVRRLFAEIETLAEQQDIGAGGWALVYLGIGDEARALEALREGAAKAASKTPDPGFFSLMNIKVNYGNDPVLEQPEFVDVRNRLSGD